MTGTTQLLTVEDHEAGLKELEVSFRSGKAPVKITLHAPTRRQARGLTFEMAQENDFWPVVKACLQGAHDEKFIDTLTPQSADLAEAICLELTFGADFQKKIQALALSEAMALTKSAAK